MLTTPEQRKIVRAIGMGQCATQSDYAHLLGFAVHVIDDLEEALDRAEKAEAERDAFKIQLGSWLDVIYDIAVKGLNLSEEWVANQEGDLLSERIRDLREERDALRAVLRIVRDMIVPNFQCNHPPDDGGDDCDGDDCIRCAVIQIDRALGEEKARMADSAIEAAAGRQKAEILQRKLARIQRAAAGLKLCDHGPIRSPLCKRCQLMARIEESKDAPKVEGRE